MFSYPKHLTLRTLGDEKLTSPTSYVTEFGLPLEKFANNMVEVMHKSKGIGLAAPQVGVSLRMCVIDLEDPREEAECDEEITLSPVEELLYPMMPVALINPRIIGYGEETNDYEEGCLSLPKTYGVVSRPTTIMLQTQLIDGREIVMECSGFLARVIQHELDHLDGLMFPDRMSAELRAEIEPKLAQLISQKQNRIFSKLLRKKG